MAKRSAIQSVPGRDALLEYEEKSYPIKAYVERNGVIYKSISATSETFVPTQWELVADFRDVRVPDIAARNSLTGNTGFIYGVHTPILDNTNVLVLDASADPEVGTVQFARYNYNAVSETWLILQIGTGATSATTSIEYANVLNRPPIVSGVTVNAGAGLTGGGAVIGNIPAAGGSITVSHADTSSQANLTPSGRTYIQQLRVDGFGHVTGATQSTWTHPDTSSQANVLNTGRTYIQSISVDGDGHVTNLSSSPWTHPDTSSQASSVNAGQTFIQTVHLDGDGHVTGIVTGVAAGGGGGGSPLSYNGDSGGALTMNSGSTLTISGGTNILTVRTGNAAVPGLQINVNPTGVQGQVQYHNGSGLGASPNLFFSAGTSTLRTSNFVIGATPTSGATSDEFLVRNIATGGAIRRVGINTISSSVLSSLTAVNGLTKVGNSFRWGGTITGNTTISGAAFDVIFSNKAVTIGSRTGTTGTNTLTAGANNRATNTNSIALGNQNKADGIYSIAVGSFNVSSGNSSHAEGAFNIAGGFYSHAEGLGTQAKGGTSHAEGNGTIASGSTSHAQNNYTVAVGQFTHAGGQGTSTRRIYANGNTSFIHSTNNASQTAGHGALADNSVILGGLNHNIEVGNTNAAIIGGQTIKLTGTSYIDHTAVANLAIMSTPALGITADDVLVRSSTTGRIRRVTQASILVPAGANTQIQFNSSGAFGASPSLVFSAGTGTVRTNQIVVGPTNNILNTTRALVVGVSNNVNGSSNGGSIVVGQSNTISGGVNSFSNIIGGVSNNVTNGSGNAIVGQQVFNSGYTSAVFGNNSTNYASGSLITGFGNFIFSGGDYSVAFGNGNRIRGSHSFVGGYTDNAAKRSVAGSPGVGRGAFTFQMTNASLGAFPNGEGGAKGAHTAVLGGLNNNIDASNSGTTIIGGNTVVIASGGSYNYHAIVSNLAIWANPSVGVVADDVLVWNTTDKKVKRVTQASIGAAGNGLNKLGNTIRLGGALTGATVISGSFNLNFSNTSWTFGTRSGATTSTGSFTSGNFNLATGFYSAAFGQQTKAEGTTSFAMGQKTKSIGIGSYAGGYCIVDTTKAVLASGDGSFNHSINTAVQTVGHGALAFGSAIIGGQDGNIESSNSRAVIVGGNAIKLTGSSYVDHTAVANLAIMSAPPAGIGADNVLVRRLTTGKIYSVTQASISDERLKKNLEPLKGVLDKIDKLSAVEFQYNELNQPELRDRKDYGLIAQQVEEQYPFVVSDNLTIEGDERRYKTVEYRKLVPILFAAIKELRAEINQLKNKSCNCNCNG